MFRVISHRGANRLAPQNTLPAFQKAVDLGAEGMELDVHLTKDGTIVVCHDYTIDRTSNGTGAVADYTYEELLQFDFGSYFSPEFAGTKIPTLAEFFELSRSMELLNVEIKSPKDKHSPIARRTIEAAKQAGLADKLLISSFDAAVLLACKEVDRSIRTALLYSFDLKETPNIAELAEGYVAYAQSIDVQALHPFMMFLDEDYAENCHKAGLLVHPWTVNEAEGMQTVIDWGCDGIITDYPDVAKNLLSKQ